MSSPYLEIMLSPSPPPPPPWNPNVSQALSRSFQTTQISAPVSISRDPNCVPYWNDQVAEWSQKLWLPIVTDSAALPSTSSSTCSPSMQQKSWFSSTMRPPMSMNFPRISLRSTLSSSV